MILVFPNCEIQVVMGVAEDATVEAEGIPVAEAVTQEAEVH